MSISIHPAKGEELEAILALLEANGLPTQGLKEHLATTLVARDLRDTVGSAALELYGTAALLRSAAVRRDRRGWGLGRRLTGAALDLARRHGAVRVYLLTETADGFFSRFGFEPVERSEAPEAVRCSVEFASACPESARAMVLSLAPAAVPGADGGTITGEEVAQTPHDRSLG